MSVTVEKRVVPPGSDEFVETAWELKERIRSEEDLLKQQWGFFSSAYRRSTVHLYVGGDDVVGFVAARRDGYILFLAVDPEFRSQGYGERLVAAVAEDHRSVTCHARTSNENALGFYDHLGFDIERRIDGYYEDAGDAYYLRLGDRQRLRDRLSDIIGR